MSLLRAIRLSLDDAVLSDGAVLLEAGGGLPKRVSGAAPLFDVIHSGNSRDVAALADGGAVFAIAILNQVRRHGPDGALVVSTSVPNNPVGVAVDESIGEIYVCVLDDNIVRVYDLETLDAIREWPFAGAGAITRLATDKIWVRSLQTQSPNVVEFDRTGEPTGRSVPIFGNNSADIAVNDEHVFQVAGGTSMPHRTRIADEVATQFGTEQARNNNLGFVWGANHWRGQICTEGPDVFVGRTISSSGVDVFDASTLEPHMRVQWPGFLPGQARHADPQRAGLDATADFLFVHLEGRFYQRLDRRTHLATWTYTPDATVRTERILVPGDLANERDGDHDLSKTSLFWRIGNGAWNELGVGGYVGELHSAPLQMQARLNSFGRPTAIPPWIGDGQGFGPTIYYDDLKRDVDLSVTTPSAITLELT